MSDTIHYIKGVFPYSVRTWLKQRFGEDGLSHILSRLGPDAREMLESPSSNDWYPASLLKEVYAAIDEEYSGKYPDIITEYGHFNAERDVKGLLRYLMKFVTMEKLLKRMRSFWKQYNQGATIEASPLKEDDKNKSIVLSVKNYDLGLAGCTSLTEYIRVLCLNTGAKDLTVKKQTCIHKGNDVCSWEVSWV
ncbi:hypothetical protein JXM67_02925 [candidate division WOR-3 bacterium]|nr:hypothetical protein [candidate division WOR-3 bacterium]